jgi:hypothetical protein
MSISWCNECEQVVEGNTINFACPNCDMLHTICRFCETECVTEINDDDPRRDDIP